VVKQKVRTVWHSHAVAFSIVFLAVLLFNNWLLALVYNQTLLLKGGSVSELSVPSEPHAWMFRVLDIASGIMFVLVAIALAKRPPKRGKPHIFLITTTLALGIANTFDALFPLRCSDTLSKTCALSVNLSLTHFSVPDHAWSSIIIGASYFLLPLAGFIYSSLHGLKTFMVVSAVAALAALASFASALEHYAASDSFGVRTLGFSQEAQMIFFGVWFVSWYFGIYTQRKMMSQII
jgi:hypothetical protein